MTRGNLFWGNVAPYWPVMEWRRPIGVLNLVKATLKSGLTGLWGNWRIQDISSSIGCQCSRLHQPDLHKFWFDLAKRCWGMCPTEKLLWTIGAILGGSVRCFLGEQTCKDVQWLESSGRVWGARLPAKFLQCVDYWRRDREDSQVVHTRPAWSKTCQSFKQVQLCGRVGWKCHWILLFTLHEVNLVAMEACKRFKTRGWLTHTWI